MGSDKTPNNVFSWALPEQHSINIILLKLDEPCHKLIFFHIFMLDLF